MLEAEGNKSKIIDTVSCIPDVKSIKTERELGDNVYEFSIDVAEDADIRRRLFFAMAAENMPILTLRSDNISLEEAFLRLTNDTQYSNKRRQQ